MGRTYEPKKKNIVIEIFWILVGVAVAVFATYFIGRKFGWIPTDFHLILIGAIFLGLAFSPDYGIIAVGSLAQLVEHLHHTQGVAGSSPVTPRGKARRRKGPGRPGFFHVFFSASEMEQTHFF